MRVTVRSAAGTAFALRNGERVSDVSFDRFLPDPLRAVSGQFWSSVKVGVQLAQWLDALAIDALVDIGSGAGKLCVVAALAGDPSRRFIGIEQRPELVAAARSLAETFEVSQRVAFRCEPIAAATLPLAPAYYLFNPFEENLHDVTDHIDEAVPLSSARFDHDVALVESVIAQAPIGTSFIFYNGYGGRLPDSFDCLFDNGDSLRSLTLWRRSERQAVGYREL